MIDIAPTQFYTYLYLDPKDGTPIYVGKGSCRRAWGHFTSKNRLGRIIRKRILEGYVVEPIISNAPSEFGALATEIFWISVYGREDLGTGTLLNRTSGGEGCSGIIHSIETREKMRAAQKGKTKSVETKAKISAAKKGKPSSEEHKAKISLGQKGRIHSEETKAKMSASAKGKQVSEETRAKMSASAKGRKAS